MARGSGNQWLPLVLGLLACGAKRSATDGGTGVIPPDDPGPDCPSNGWCWDNGNDGADASVPAPARLTSAWSSGPNDRWAVGTAGTVLHKVGTTWSPVNVGTNVWLNGIWGTGPDDVWIVGGAGTILHKDGAAWFKVIVPTTQTLNAIWGSASDDFWIAGDGGTIFHRAGASWYTVNSGTTLSLRAGWGSGPKDVWAVGDRGTILHWNGTSGSLSSSGTHVDLFAAGGTGPADAWVVGQQGMILHWNGTNWSPFASNAFIEPAPTPPTLQGVWAGGPDDVWAVGKAGIVVHWNGVRWTPDNSGTSRDLFAVRAEVNGTVWAAADGEGILRRVGEPAGGAPNGGHGAAFEPAPRNCTPNQVFRFFSAESTTIEGVTAVILRNEQSGSSSTITAPNLPTIYSDRSTGISVECGGLGTGARTITGEAQGPDGCLATASTTVTVLDDITAIDFVFATEGCAADAGVDQVSP